MHNWCLQLWYVLTLRPLSVESVLAMTELLDTVQNVSRAAKHVVIQASLSQALKLPPSSSGFHRLSLWIPCFLMYLPVQPHTGLANAARANMSGLDPKPQHTAALHVPVFF